jgi:hypothetical protein
MSVVRNESGRSRTARLVAGVDGFIFVKNGYSVWTHLVPFAIAALLLVILSLPDLPQDNLLLQLVHRLEKPSWIWVPAAFLTAVAALVYIVTVREQIRKAYLWPTGDHRRIAGTCVSYIILCTVMAYVVLSSVPSYQATVGGIWACLLLALLSLTGLGWSGPGKWVESIGVKSPDYTDGRQAARELTEILQRVRGQPRGTKRDVEDFVEAGKELRSSVETNLESEPEWATEQLDEASSVLRTLIEEVQERFPTGDASAVEDFAPACRCQQEFLYGEFIVALRRLGNYWPEWRCEEHQ